MPPPYPIGIKASLAISFIRAMLGPFAPAVRSRITISSTPFSLNILTALIGSPTYLWSLNLIDLTSPPFCINKPGMTLILFINNFLQNSPIVSFQIDGFSQDGIELREYCYVQLLQ